MLEAVEKFLGHSKPGDFGSYLPNHPVYDMTF
jgi:hypothetical protein